jgi:hypothetical protein
VVSPTELEISSLEDSDEDPQETQLLFDWFPRGLESSLPLAANIANPHSLAMPSITPSECPLACRPKAVSEDGGV